MEDAAAEFATEVQADVEREDDHSEEQLSIEVSN